MANTDPIAPHNMGVRANNTTLARLLDLQEAEAGGADLGRMHVTADGASLQQLLEDIDLAKVYIVYFS